MKRGGLFHLIDGFIIAFSGTNKQKTKKGIVLTIGSIICIFFVWAGLILIGFRPDIDLVDGITMVVAGLASKAFATFLGFFLIISIGIPTLAYVLALFFLIIGSLISLFKHTENEGSALAAFLVNLIGFLLVVGFGILIFI